MASILNNSTTPLVGNASFAGAYEQVHGYHGMNVMIFSDQNGSLDVTWSSDGSNADVVDTISHSGGASGTWKQLPIKARFVKCDYTNGSSDQLSFRLAVQYLKSAVNELEVSLDSANDSVSVVQATHDSLNMNANLQVGDSDVSGSNKVPCENAVLEAVDFATETTLDACKTALEATLTVDGSGVTQPVSAVSLPLPTGASTETTLDAVKSAVEGTLTVDGSASTQPVSAVSLPLPTGASSETTLDACKTALEGTLSVSDSNIPSGLTVSAGKLLVDSSNSSTTLARYLDLDSTGEVVKSSAGTVRSISMYNRSGFEHYVKLYDKASAPSPSGDTPVHTFVIQPYNHVSVDYSAGLTMSNGIAVRACTGLADNDATDPSTNDCVVNMTFE